MRTVFDNSLAIALPVLLFIPAYSGGQGARRDHRDPNIGLMCGARASPMRSTGVTGR